MENKMNDNLKTWPESAARAVVNESTQIRRVAFFDNPGSMCREIIDQHGHVVRCISAHSISQKSLYLDFRPSLPSLKPWGYFSMPIDIKD